LLPGDPGMSMLRGMTAERWREMFSDAAFADSPEVFIAGINVFVASPEMAEER
jgi:hypothetical protein